MKRRASAGSWDWWVRLLRCSVPVAYLAIGATCDYFGIWSDAIPVTMGMAVGYTTALLNGGPTERRGEGQMIKESADG